MNAAYVVEPNPKSNGFAVVEVGSNVNGGSIVVECNGSYWINST